MTSLRNAVGFLIVLAFAAFALPAIAHDDDDSFTVVMAPGATAGTFTAKITSTERDDEETIRSFKIIAPTGAMITSSSIASSSTGSYSGATRVPATIPAGGTGSVTYKNVTIKYNKFILVNLTATLPSASGCGAHNYLWAVNAWERSDATGSQFDLDQSHSTLQTSVTTTCYTLTYNKGTCDSLTGTSPQTVVSGGTGTAVTANAATGYHFVSWSDGVLTASRTDTGVTASKNVTASCAITTFPVAPSAPLSNGSMNPPNAQVPYGTIQVFTLTPATGYHVASVGGSCGGTLSADFSTFTTNAVTGACTVDPVFAINTYTLTYLAGPGGTITGTSPQTVNYGFSGTAVTAVATSSGKHFVQWNDGSTDNPRTDTNVQADATYTASFGDGVLGCAGGNNGDPGFGDGSFVTGFRGPNNKDGSVCNPAVYDLSADAANKTAALFIDPIQPQAVTSAEIAWPADFVDPATGLPKATKVAWQFNGSGDPIFFTGQYCISTDLPAPYGTLTAAIVDGTTTSINFTSGVTFDFTGGAKIPIVVDTERMNMTAYAAGMATVERGVGTAGVGVAHALNYPSTSTPKSVMSTPFPLDASGNVMLVCLAAESCQTVPANQCSPLDPAKTCVKCTSTIFGDWVTSR